jgi:D-alanyl-D-alanine carboxypeptidase/D-alanyl-D-alanine-endopeptidase (penicillin-binding protein 4)
VRLRLIVLCVCAVAAVLPPRLSAQDRPGGLLARTIAPTFRGRAWRNATWGALVVSLTRGDTLFSYHADRHFLPASNAKLFTTAAALHYLGPEFRFVTLLAGDGPVRDSTLNGNLVLYGTGDPTFGMDTASLAPFADSVALLGIRRIQGDIVGDASFLGGELFGPGWLPDNLEEPYAAPPSALGVAANRIRLVVQPGAEPGAPAQVTIDPPTDYVTVSSLVVTGRSRSRTRISVERSLPRGLTLSGTISPRRAWTTQIVVRQPPLFAAGQLRQLLAARGVTVLGTTRSVTDDASGRARTLLARARGETGSPFEGALAVRSSPSLGDLVTVINHRSDNLSAELVFRAIGRAVGGAGTFASGARAVARFLTDEVGIDPSSVQVTDGSGLSMLDAATPRALVQLLAYERRAAEGGVFWRSLPVAGEGLLRGRMGGTAAEGRLRAKTGTMNDASALAGYVTTVQGEELAFSIIVNNPRRISSARAVQDRIGVMLAEFSR